MLENINLFIDDKNIVIVVFLVNPIVNLRLRLPRSRAVTPFLVAPYNLTPGIFHISKGGLRFITFLRGAETSSENNNTARKMNP